MATQLELQYMGMKEFRSSSHLISQQSGEISESWINGHGQSTREIKSTSPAAVLLRFDP